MRTTEARDAQESALPCALSQARQNGERMGIAPPCKTDGDLVQSRALAGVSLHSKSR